MHVEMLPPEWKIKYLGQMITLVDQETTEVQHRIRCAWSAFTKHRQEPTSLFYRLQHLFDAVVTPTITYGAGTWATVKEHVGSGKTSLSPRCPRRSDGIRRSTFALVGALSLDINTNRMATRPLRPLPLSPLQLPGREVLMWVGLAHHLLRDICFCTAWLAAAINADDRKKRERQYVTEGARGIEIQLK